MKKNNSPNYLTFIFNLLNASFFFHSHPLFPSQYSLFFLCNPATKNIYKVNVRHHSYKHIQKRDQSKKPHTPRFTTIFCNKNCKRKLLYHIYKLLFVHCFVILCFKKTFYYIYEKCPLCIHNKNEILKNGTIYIPKHKKFKFQFINLQDVLQFLSFLIININTIKIECVRI